MNSMEAIIAEIRAGLESGEFTGDEIINEVRSMVWEIEAELAEMDDN